MNERAHHDHAWKGARSILAIFEPLLREEEQRDAFDLVYSCLKEILLDFDLAARRESARLHPTDP